MAKKTKFTTNVYFIVDQSGSMASIKDVAISGFNGQLKELFEADENIKVSVILFNNEVQVVNWAGSKDEVVPLSAENYDPHGSTSMLDAIGTTLLLAKGEWNKKDYNLVVVISDGYENSSKHYSWATNKGTIQDLTATGKWNFAYIGANQSMWEINRNLGIRNTMNWVNDFKGTRDMYTTSSAGLGGYVMAASAGAAPVKLEGFDNLDGNKQDPLL